MSSNMKGFDRMKEQFDAYSPEIQVKLEIGYKNYQYAYVRQEKHGLNYEQQSELLKQAKQVDNRLFEYNPSNFIELVEKIKGQKIEVEVPKKELPTVIDSDISLKKYTGTQTNIPPEIHAEISIKHYDTNKKSLEKLKSGDVPQFNENSRFKKKR